MKVLIVKMSSLGDVIHTLPAIHDAVSAHPEIEFHWVVEKSFSEIPAFSAHVKKIIPIEFRRWRKQGPRFIFNEEFKQFKKNLVAEKYDLIIDAQGLLKSAMVAKLARGPIAGFNFNFAREKIASLFYQKKYSVEKKQHAVTRLRELFAQALNYPCPQTVAHYGIDIRLLPKKPLEINDYLIFLHGTTWDSKHYPEEYWQELIATCSPQKILLPWGNLEEKLRAERLAKDNAHVTVLPKCSLSEIARLLADAKYVVAVDTGLGHLAAALGAPTISLYGPTNPEQIGTIGKNQTHLAAKFPCAPCKQRRCTYEGESEAKPACFTTIKPAFIKEKMEG